ncbi:DUF5085 family protein [Sutcliffiella cohnii]|uniref:DUF5085 domain-containing protein n=1 Tax=Sutcliffiella cohnii TaxID=33932 RepID=A0A223KVQ0_9BACI|nr:DUF5085 family protein [Sutcliffiella cohnii]AST93454.1 DUF5085 domain-containing protein [Sutcliffiella cohnii]MED4014552.1 DUF5085 family protein [Sutcliffiella cohnii]
MKIKRTSMMFNNVIKTTYRTRMDQWYEEAKTLRNAIINNGLYGTGPVIYQVENIGDSGEEIPEADYTFHVPINQPVTMEENAPFSFDELLHYEDGLLLRHADLDEDIEESYEILRACAEANNFLLKEPFYNIYLDVYGDGIIDIFAPIEKEE